MVECMELIQHRFDKWMFSKAAHARSNITDRMYIFFQGCTEGLWK